jgi:hypothetical protein
MPQVKRDVANRIQYQLEALAAQARAAGLETLADLIEMARREAEARASRV